MVFSILSHLANILFNLVFWKIFATYTTNVDFNKMFAYSMMTEGITSIIMIQGGSPTRVGRIVRRAVQDGSFSSYILLPYNTIRHTYLKGLGLSIFNITFGILEIIIAIIINFASISPLSVFYFILSLILAIWMSLILNMFEGALSIVYTEASGIKNALAHIQRLLSGRMIPISLFPILLRMIAQYSPFSITAYIPAQLIFNQIEEGNITSYLLIGLLWCIFLYLLVHLFWKSSLKKYEAYGL